MEPILVHILGTMATAPTGARNVTALMFQHGGDRTLIDCGEGTQRQLRTCLSTGPGAIDRLLVTHYHADHYLGIPGLIKTRSQNDVTPPLDIYGPADVVRNLKKLLDVTFTDSSLYALHTVQDGDTIELDRDVHITAFATSHGVPSVGYALIEKEHPGRFDADRARALGVPNGPLMGKLANLKTVTLDDGTVIDGTTLVGEARPGRTIVYSGDTLPCERLAQIAVDADLLIHEATFLEADKKLAKQTNHTTAHQAGTLAKICRAKELCLIHFSGRYPVRETAKEAAKAFGSRVMAPRDGDSFLVMPDGKGVRKMEQT